jgi:hypothetical protein
MAFSCISGLPLNLAAGRSVLGEHDNHRRTPMPTVMGITPIPGMPHQFDLRLEHVIFVGNEEPAYAQRSESRQTVLMGQRG